MEDLVIFVADVIASIYLEIMSVDGDMPTEVVGSSLALCSLSTRELQKQRNEVIVVAVESDAVPLSSFDLISICNCQASTPSIPN